MTSPLSVRAPGGFAPEVAIAFGTQDGVATAVDGNNPLPTRDLLIASGIAPVAGSLSASAVVGPFAPLLGRAFWLTLSGTWAGSAQLLRSIDGGATKLALTYGDGSAKGVWSANLNAAVAEESVAGATYYLAATLTSGTLVYRMEQ